MSLRWTRRQFVGSAAAAGGLRAMPAVALAFPQEGIPPPKSQAQSPEITTGHITPLFEGNIARPLRYRFQDGAFVIHNGREFFNRPLYGPNIRFRVDGGDSPEFSLYLPGHGGNLRLGLASTHTARSKWLFECESITARYVAGRMEYEIRDPLIGLGVLHVQALTVGAGFALEVTGSELPQNIELTSAFGGVSGRKGERNGDIGCEKEPVSQFFQVRPEECSENRWVLPITSDKQENSVAEVSGNKIRLRLTNPAGTELKLSNAEHWNDGWQKLWDVSSGEPPQPVLIGRTKLGKEQLLIRVDVLEGAQLPVHQSNSSTSDSFAVRHAALETLSSAVSWKTPDPFLDGIAPALCIAADAIWDEEQGCVMHGAVAWRTPLAGWRGPHALDALGWHERMKKHLRHWIARQDTSATVNGSSGTPTSAGFKEIVSATGSADPGSHFARCENLLHSNGDLSHNHYDMNLVFFDALIRHLCWTGDMEFAHEAWPALERHAAWERRLFRRDYGDEANSLPLYEAYAAIWASDNLQYNGGGATHSSAYNVFLNRNMAAIARLLGQPKEVVTSYRAEADAITRAMRQLLWMPERGAFAESRDWLGEKTLCDDPAFWTVYHTVDSEVVTAKEAWQMAAERLSALRKVPVVGEGVPTDAGWQIPCSDWQPYVWSLTLLVLAENLHTALALFQAGMADEGYALLRGNLIDAGYRGLCPGNFPMSLQLDPHRQESQRDFGDPIGCAARAIVEGLWGIQPDLLNKHLRLKPQLPLTWTEAAFQHPELQLSYKREGLHETWNIVPAFRQTPVRLTLELRARSTSLPAVRINGTDATAHFLSDAVGEPRLAIDVTAITAPWRVDIQWHGAAPVARPQQALRCSVGERIVWPAGISTAHIDDPQKCLANGRATLVGNHTVFALQEHDAAMFWLPIELRIAERPLPPERHVIRERFEPVPLGPLFTSNISEILSRSYAQPRSPYCSLALPDGLLGGWANFDVKASIDDAGLRNSGGAISFPNGLRFQTPAATAEPNCCFLSQWRPDKPRVSIALHGHAKSVHLLLACTTFPQATNSRHATATAHYAVGKPSTVAEMRSPLTWWPIEQDYLLDDYIFRIGDADDAKLPWRVDLRNGQVRKLTQESLRRKAGNIPGGAAFVFSMPLDPARELASLEIHCELYGVVMGLLAVTLGR